MAAACVTDNVAGPEPDGLAAKSRVIDTPKTRSAAKTDAAKSAAARTAAKTVPAEQGDGGPRTVAAVAPPDPQPEPKSAPAPRRTGGVGIPAQSLFGNWTLGREGEAQTCRIVLGGVLVGAAYAARGAEDCPPAFSAVQTWEIQGDELVLRNPSRGVVGRLSPTGPFRFDGTGEGGAAVYLIR